MVSQSQNGMQCLAPPPTSGQWVPPHMVLYNLGGASQGLVFYEGYYADKVGPVNTNLLQFGGTEPSSVVDLDKALQPPLSGWNACAAMVVGGAFAAAAVYQGPIGVAEIGALYSLGGFAQGLFAIEDNFTACSAKIQSILGTDQSNPVASIDGTGQLADLFDPSYQTDTYQLSDPVSNNSYIADGLAVWGDEDHAAGNNGGFTVADDWENGAKVGGVGSYGLAHVPW